jgi:hypothetical protein
MIALATRGVKRDIHGTLKLQRNEPKRSPEVPGVRENAGWALGNRTACAEIVSASDAMAVFGRGLRKSLECG